MRRAASSSLILVITSNPLALAFAFGSPRRQWAGIARTLHAKAAQQYSFRGTVLDAAAPTTTTTSSDEYGNDKYSEDQDKNEEPQQRKGPKKVVIIGAGWGGLSAAHALSTRDNDNEWDITVVDAAVRVGGVVRDGYRSMSGNRPAEAGQHGFWDNYGNIFALLQDDLKMNLDDVLTDYAEQGQYSPTGGLEAVWPVYRQHSPTLPTGLAQALYTKFRNLPPWDLATAFPLVLAFSEFNDSKDAWKLYDDVSFRDLCTRLGVSRRCYQEAFEPMILTGLFAPGSECSAAAALGMAYFFVLQSQTAFDVRWCRGNIGDQIFQPWVEQMQEKGGVHFQTSTRVVGFEMAPDETKTPRIGRVLCQTTGDEGNQFALDADVVIFGVGAAALNAMVRNSPPLAPFEDFRRFANLRGTSVLATRLYLDRKIDIPYSANACWGVDEGVGMTFFDISTLHGENCQEEGTVVEVDYYHASSLLVMDNETICRKAKRDLDSLLGPVSASAQVVDAAIVRLPQGVNWYFPGSYKDMPDTVSSCVANAYFVGDIVRSRHGSWSQEKAYVTGIEAANAILGGKADEGIIPVPQDEVHVAAGRQFVETFKSLLGGPSRAPSLVDFLW